jgi:hypothetical protein
VCVKQWEQRSEKAARRRKEERIGNREEGTDDGGERELTEVHMGEGEMIVDVVGYKT